MRLDGVSLTLYLLLRFSIFSTLAIFVIVIGFICIKGVGYLNLGLFEWEYNSENVSMMPAIINTINMVIFSLAIAVPLGIFGAIFLNEYSKSTNKIVGVISVAAETLVGIPSIVYGLFGYLAFVIYFKMGNSFLAGALTLSIMILPLVLRSGQEALKAVPMSFREASFALGAGKLRTIFSIIVPAALPGILAGVILSIGKIVGESAALLYTSGAVPQVAGLFDSGATLSVHMYTISSEGLHINEAYSTAMVLIVIVLIINICANFIARRLTKA
ncbi:phosphate ABC transporter permease PstA [Helicobacter saguini]|uniref:Phosphate transport system permease protein PstA n=2 Tax=Helicobacter saguini TaxID=1548018 RepID=A0A347W0B5_9HELI|nr:phosphate ABC transporter permease PstA [Helicobacter saguini]MWV66494.1 phosphate ABC transporter permease PstA [Helicobacter saguini]MWV68843.1 phosphate ABC transporter permease PstA [Helicobacter saguini]MWV71602.1 phosphate ABC transporter permease PstA [Helicobacter saguini]TLD94483.1 phosphate ABC transporter permease PstA [Helicobacter saguini]